MTKEPFESLDTSPAPPPGGFPSPAEPGIAGSGPPPELPKRRPLQWLRDYFLGEDPTFSAGAVPFALLSIVLYTRHPFKTNYIFDEQEALLANPYVRAVTDPNSKIRWIDAFYRDFWGLTNERTIGSYRPIPNLIWRALWMVTGNKSVFLHHWVNVLLHGINGALVTLLVFRWVKDRFTAWLAGAVFVASAIVTEAVSGVVGLADVLGGLGALLGLLALSLPLWAMPFAVFASVLLGLYSKESALCLVPLIPAAALLTSQLTHPQRPLRWARMGAAAVAAGGAFYFYVEARKRCFPVSTPYELTVEANADKSQAHQVFSALLRWYAQPILPRDPLNNPLVSATPDLRIAGALRVYFRGIVQVLFPWTLSGDYSAPQEPIPDKPIFVESMLGALGMVVPFIMMPVLGFAAWWRERVVARKYGRDAPTAFTNVADLRPIVALCLVWIVVSYFPVSNIPVVLPTVRAERFWYFPIVGSCILIAFALVKFFRKTEQWKVPYIGAALIGVFLGFQGLSARLHANDYSDDLAFWDATRKAVPQSSKAHLNYSVMLGARGDLPGRLVANQEAYRLAPKWPMASVYLGDTLCRMHRAPEAFDHYLRGFDLGPNDMHLIALGVQCLWDEGLLADDRPERETLRGAAAQHPGSWFQNIVDDTLLAGAEYKGVNPKHRPRGYNEGPKE